MKLSSRYQFAARSLYLLATPLLLPSITGCGGGSTSSTPSSTRLTPVQLDIAWPARTRALTAPAAALSVVITLKGANATGSDFTWQINREDNLTAHTGHYTSPVTAKAGATTIHARFYAQVNGGGAVVGTVDAPVTLATNGTGIGTLATAGTAASIAADTPPALIVGQTAQLTFTVKDAANNLLAVTPGSAVWKVVSGGDKLTLTPDGKATGIIAGTAGVQVSMDGKSSATQNVTVSAVTPAPGYIVFGATSSGVVSGASGNDVYIANADGSNIRLLASEADYPALSPDKSRVIYEGLDGLHVINTDGSNARLLIAYTDTLRGAEVPSFSPDGTQITFTSRDQNLNYQIFVANADGSSLRQVTSGNSDAQNGAFTPNGKQIVYESPDGLSIINVDGTSPHTFIAKTSVPGGLSGGPSRPVFSPDGTRMVFYTYNDKDTAGNLAVFVANADGTNIKQIPNITTGRGNPSFTPDGTGIVYAGDHFAGNDGIYVINLDGTNQRLLIPQTSTYDELDYPRLRRAVRHP